MIASRPLNQARACARGNGRGTQDMARDDRGRWLFKVFAAKMFEQRVLSIYRERVRGHARPWCLKPARLRPSL